MTSEHTTTEADPPEFRRELVPEGPAADMFFDGRTGRGLTNAEYDETKRRLLEHEGQLPWEVTPDVG